MKTQDWKDLPTVSAAGFDVLGEGTGKTMWKYEQLRAGKVYAKFMFNTREQAESFASQMTKVEPDLFCRIEPVEASAVWN
jgi:hypothetical protein